VNMTMLD